MSKDKNLKIGRRRLLAGGATGVALAAWHKPLIESVLLPAHAQTSDVSPIVFSVAGVNGGPIVSQQNSILNLLIPLAYAGDLQEQGPTAEFTIRAEDTSGDLTNFSVGLFTRVVGLEGFDKVETVHEGEVSVASGGELTPTQVPCDALETADIDVEIVTAESGLFSLRLLGLDLVLDAPPVDIPLPVAECVATPIEDFGDFASFSEPPEGTIMGTLLDAVVPTAIAGESVVRIIVEDLVAINTFGNSTVFEVTYQDGTSRWRGDLNVDGTPSGLGLIDSCEMDAPGSINAKINSIGVAGLTLQVDAPTNPMGVYNLDPAVNPVLPDLFCAVLEG